MRFLACLLVCGLLSWAAEPAQVVFDKAAQALMSGDYPAAERGFEAVLREQPLHVGALGNLGIIYSRTGRAAQAIAVYQRALRVSPDDKAILLNLGLAYLKQEAHQKALPLFERVVKLDPRDRQARQLLALCQVYTGRLAPAIQELEALRAANPADEQILFLLGFAQLKNKNPEGAKQIFSEMLAVAGPARAQFLLGRAYYEAALFARAEESYLEVQKLDPNFPGLRLELGKLYTSQRRTEDAIRELESVIRAEPNNEDANYFLGGLLVQEGRYQESIPYLERAIRLKPDSSAALFYLGKAKLRLDQPAQALALLQKSVELNSDEPSAWYQLGRALQAGGRRQEAARAFEKVKALGAGALHDSQIVGIR